MTVSFVNWHLEKYRRSDIQTWPMDIIVKFLYKQYTKKKQKKNYATKTIQKPSIQPICVWNVFENRMFSKSVTKENFKKLTLFFISSSVSFYGHNWKTKGIWN